MIEFDAEWVREVLAERFVGGGEAFDRWLAKHDAGVAAKAWDEGRLAEGLAWKHTFKGHLVPEGEMCDECVVENPYRKAVKS